MNYSSIEKIRILSVEMGVSFNGQYYFDADVAANPNSTPIIYIRGKLLIRDDKTKHLKSLYAHDTVLIYNTSSDELLIKAEIHDSEVLEKIPNDSKLFSRVMDEISQVKNLGIGERFITYETESQNWEIDGEQFSSMSIDLEGKILQELNADSFDNLQIHLSVIKKNGAVADLKTAIDSKERE